MDPHEIAIKENFLTSINNCIKGYGRPELELGQYFQGRSGHIQARSGQWFWNIY